MNFKRDILSVEGIHELLSYAPINTFGLLNRHRGEVIVNLTSVPWRFEKLHLVLNSLLYQYVRPNRIILWLSEHDRNGKKVIDKDRLPANIAKMRRRGIQVEFVDDIRSYRKLVPALEQYPDATLVTADDDTIYPPTWLAQLLRLSNKHPDKIVCHRGVRMLVKDNCLLPYAQWPEHEASNQPSCLLFAQGGEGTLYPPGSLHPEVLNRDVFMEISPTADDVWFNAMAVYNNVSRVKIADQHADFKRLRHSQHEGDTLHHVNNTLGHNDKQIAAVFSHYGLISMLRSNSSI